MVIEVVFYFTYDAIFNVNNLVGLVSHTAFMRHYDCLLYTSDAADEL